MPPPIRAAVVFMGKFVSIAVSNVVVDKSLRSRTKVPRNRSSLLIQISPGEYLFVADAVMRVSTNVEGCQITEFVSAVVPHPSPPFAPSTAAAFKTSEGGVCALFPGQHGFACASSEDAYTRISAVDSKALAKLVPGKSGLSLTALLQSESAKKAFTTKIA